MMLLRPFFIEIYHTIQILCVAILLAHIGGLQAAFLTKEVEEHSLDLKDETAIAANEEEVNKRVKRAYHQQNVGCRGVFNKAIFAKLDQLCNDCYDLFRLTEIHNLCR